MLYEVITGTNDVSVLLGNGVGGFERERRFAVGTAPSWVTVADANGDGAPDLVIANNGSDDVTILVGDARGVDAAREEVV